MNHMILIILCCIFSKIKCLFIDIPNHKFYINEVQVNAKTRFMNIFLQFKCGIIFIIIDTS